MQEHNIGLDLVRATEAATLRAGRWMGAGKKDEVDKDAAQVMAQVLNEMHMRGTIVVGEEGKLDWSSPLETGTQVGRGEGPALDVVVDPIDGLELLAEGRQDAVSVAAVAPRGSMWSPGPAVYMEKLIVDRTVAEALVPECLDAPVAWTLALIARQKQKAVRDLLVFVLDRPRHYDLVEEIRTAGARVMLRQDGDVAGGLIAATPERGVDALFGIGGVPEGVITACAVKALNGAMLGRLAPQGEEERKALDAADLDARRILTADDLVSSNEIFFAATGVTDGYILKGVRYHHNRAYTESMILRCETHTRRTIYAEHLLENGSPK